MSGPVLTGEIITKEELERERAERKVAIDPYVEVAQSMEITTSADAEEATEYLGDLARLAKDVEERRKELKAPFIKWGKEIDEHAKKLSVPIAEARALVEPKLLAYRKAAQERIDAENARAAEELRIQQELADEKARKEAEAAAAKLAEAQATGDAEQVQEAAHELAVAAEVQTIDPEPYAPIEQENTIRASNGASANVRKTWKATVVDPFEVPREYLAINEKAINAAVKAGVREIPGVVIEQVEGLAIRT